MLLSAELKTSSLFSFPLISLCSSTNQLGSHITYSCCVLRLLQAATVPESFHIFRYLIIFILVVLNVYLNAQIFQQEEPSLVGNPSLESPPVIKEKWLWHRDLLKQSLIPVLGCSECITSKSFVWSSLVWNWMYIYFYFPSFPFQQVPAKCLYNYWLLHKLLWRNGIRHWDLWAETGIQKSIIIELKDLLA